jgi:endonuclease III
MAGNRKALVERLLAEHGETFAEQAGIRLADKPSPLYQLLVLATLLSARISADVAVAAARELFRAGCRTPRKMAGATWQQRVDALGRGHYRRYDERTATMLGDGAALLLDRWRGDLRRLHAEAGSTKELRELLQEFPGIGPTGADIVLREAQAVWPDVAPYLDDRVRRGAEALGLPRQPARLKALVPPDRLPHLAAALVRVSGRGRLAERLLAG